MNSQNSRKIIVVCGMAAVVVAVVFVLRAHNDTLVAQAPLPATPFTQVPATPAVAVAQTPDAPAGTAQIPDAPAAITQTPDAPATVPHTQ